MFASYAFALAVAVFAASLVFAVEKGQIENRGYGYVLSLNVLVVSFAILLTLGVEVFLSLRFSGWILSFFGAMGLWVVIAGGLVVGTIEFFYPLLWGRPYPEKT